MPDQLCEALSPPGTITPEMPRLFRDAFIVRSKAAIATLGLHFHRMMLMALTHEQICLNGYSLWGGQVQPKLVVFS